MARAQIKTAGFDGFLVTFGDALSEPANRAALAFRSALKTEGWDAVKETSTSLVSTYVRFNPFEIAHDALETRLASLVDSRDWHAEPLPANRTLWRIPTCFEPEFAPQIDEAASAAGLSRDAAVASICDARVRVFTIGFAPGMPYLGELPEAWDIPRQTQLSDNVPAGALCVAIRQLVLFPRVTPTGWRHIGQTRFNVFQPESKTPFLLTPGDEVTFTSVSADRLADVADDVFGGAESEVIS